MKKNNIKEKATRIQDLLTLCLAIATDTALSASKGQDWFTQFKEEEKSERFPITREEQNNIKDCDFQALLKILYYRYDYSKIILEYYGQSNAIRSGNPEYGTPFQRTIGRLMLDYRNSIAAHVSAEKIHDNIKGKKESKFYDYPQAIQDMVGVAKVFSAVKSEDGINFYNEIKKEANTKGSIIGLIIGVLIAVLIAVALFVIKPWNQINNEPIVEDELNILDDLQIDVETEIQADNIAKEFCKRFNNKISKGISPEKYSRYFSKDYSEEQIKDIISMMGERAYKDEDIRMFAFVKDGIVAYQKLDKYYYSIVLRKYEDGWKFATANEELANEFNKKIEERYGADCKDGYYSQNFDVLFQEVGDKLELNIATARFNQSGDLELEIQIHNGTHESVKGLELKHINIVCIDADMVEKNIAYLGEQVMQCNDEIQPKSIMIQKMRISADKCFNIDLTTVIDMKIEYE